MVEISAGRRRIGCDSENVINEEGQSSESVTHPSNSTGPPHDYESSDTSLKLGYVISFPLPLRLKMRAMYLVSINFNSCICEIAAYHMVVERKEGRFGGVLYLLRKRWELKSNLDRQTDRLC